MTIKTLTIFLALSSISNASPALSLPRQIDPQKWRNVKCDIPSIQDERVSVFTRWADTDARNAYSAVGRDWNQHAPPKNSDPLTFPQHVSNFFHGPPNNDCQDLGDSTCDVMKQCDDFSSPAGWMIFNSMVALHQVGRHVDTALEAALNSMQNDMGTFTTTFAPQLEDSSIFRAIITDLAMMIGIGSAYSWNVVAKRAKWFENDDHRGVAKDSVNTLIAGAIASGRDHLPAAASLQNSLTGAMGDMFGAWKTANSAYIRSIFSGTVQAQGDFGRQMGSGFLASVPKAVNDDLTTLTDNLKTIMWTKMITNAWKVAPGNLKPVIVMSDNPCNSQAEGDLKGSISDSVAAQTHVCYDNKIFYVVNYVLKDGNGHVPYTSLEALPGGTFDNLSGGKWSGVRLDDFVISAYEGYKNNGNKNGYPSPDTNSAGVEGNFVFEKGTQTPGFTSMSICKISTYGELNPNYSCQPRVPCLTGAKMLAC